jgi:hypothetical protein
VASSSDGNRSSPRQRREAIKRRDEGEETRAERLPAAI